MVLYAEFGSLTGLIVAMDSPIKNLSIGPNIAVR